jgi:hypothetical protein
LKFIAIILQEKYEYNMKYEVRRLKWPNIRGQTPVAGTSTGRPGAALHRDLAASRQPGPCASRGKSPPAHFALKAG